MNKHKYTESLTTMQLPFNLRMFDEITHLFLI